MVLFFAFTLLTYLEFIASQWLFSKEKFSAYYVFIRIINYRLILSMLTLSISIFLFISFNWPFSLVSVFSYVFFSKGGELWHLLLLKLSSRDLLLPLLSIGFLSFSWIKLEQNVFKSYSHFLFLTWNYQMFPLYSHCIKINSI